MEAEEAIKKMAQITAEYDAMHDPWIYRMVTVALGIIALTCIGSAVYLASWGIEVPQFLTAVGSAAGGGMVAILTNPPK